MSKQGEASFKFRGFKGPNYTMVPDELFDELMVELSGGELKVLMYIIRRTFGFKRDSDSISLSQMMNGITTRDGRTLDRGVGISKPTLLQALRSLEEKNVIETERQRSVERGDEPTVYRLKFADGVLQQEILPPVVKKVDQGGGQENLPGGGQESSPGPWSRKLTTQETVVQETDLNPSNIRRVSPIEKNDTGTVSPAARSDASIPVRFRRPLGSDKPTPLRGRESASFEGIGSVLGKSRPQPASPAEPPDEARQVLLEYIEDYAREFSDQAPLKSSTTRAYNLYRQSGLTIGGFIARMQEARSVTKESTAQIRAQLAGPGTPAKKKMPYFFACLEDLLGLREDGDHTIDGVQKSS